MITNTFDKQELQQKINLCLYENRYSKKMANSLISDLFERVPSSKITDLTKGDFVNLTINELYWLAKGLDNLGYKTDYAQYFKIQEVNEAENYLINQAVNNKALNEIIIENVIKLREDEYIVVNMPLKKISEYYERGINTYNYDTQREATLVDTGIGIVYTPTVYSDAVDDMADKMINRKFFDNMITWNILNTGQEKFDYNEETKQLKFIKDKGSMINTIDGYHRTLAIIKALNKKPELANEFMQVKILNYDVKKALEYINQEQKGASFSGEKRKSIETNNYTKLVDYLNKSGRSNLMEKISVIDDEVYKYRTKYVMFGTLTDTIKHLDNDLDNLTMQSEINNKFRHYEKIFNHIITFFEKDFNEQSESEHGTVYTKNSMFIGYTWLSYKLEGDEEWEYKLDTFLDTIRKNPLLITFNTNTKRNDFQTRKTVMSDFENIWKKLFEVN